MIRVLLVGDRPVLLAGLRSQLAGESALSVAGHACPGSGTFELTADLRPDVILVDCPAGRGAFVLCHQLGQLARPQRVVLQVTDPTPRLQIAAWVAGADGLVSAATPAPQLIETVRSVAAGRRRLPRPSIAAVRTTGQRLEAPDLSIFGMRMHAVSSHDISGALRLDPLEVDRRVRSLVERLSRGHVPAPELTGAVALDPVAVVD